MNIFFDTEFYVTRDQRVIPISIGAVRDDGEMFYAEMKEFDWNIVPKDDWLQTHVRPHLKGEDDLMYLADVQDRLRKFAPGNVQWWAYYGAYDWYCLCQLMGGWFALPKGWNKSCFDVKQHHTTCAPQVVPPKKYAIEHHALNDAHWNRQFHMAIEKGRAIAAIEFLDGIDPQMSRS
jgi:hypothetical protein